MYCLNCKKEYDGKFCPTIGISLNLGDCEFNGNHILDLLLVPNGRDIEVYTDCYVYIRDYSGGIRKNKIQ